MNRISKKIKGLDFKPILLGEEVSRLLRDAILEGVFKGGDPLVEDDLKKELNISRSPLREAFRDLEERVR